MKKIKVKKSSLIYEELRKRYVIDYNGKKLEVEKWLKDDYDYMEFDNDWDFIRKEDREYYNGLSSEEQYKFAEFMLNLDLYEDDMK